MGFKKQLLGPGARQGNPLENWRKSQEDSVCLTALGAGCWDPSWAALGAGAWGGGSWQTQENFQRSSWEAGIELGTGVRNPGKKTNEAVTNSRKKESFYERQRSPRELCALLTLFTLTQMSAVKLSATIVSQSIWELVVGEKCRWMWGWRHERPKSFFITGSR